MKRIRNMGCLGLILGIIFLIMAAYSGGDQFREWADQAPEVVKKYFIKVANTADDIKRDTDQWKESVGRNTGAKKKYE